jgi:DNA-binding XRE family transcriptional regulator
MAKALGLTRQTIGLYETGRLAVPKYIAIAVRCLALHRSR